MNKNIRKEILNNHTSFWLDLDNETIIDRINKSAKRPLALNSTKSRIVGHAQKKILFLFKSII